MLYHIINSCAGGLLVLIMGAVPLLYQPFLKQNQAKKHIKETKEDRKQLEHEQYAPSLAPNELTLFYAQVRSLI